MWRAASLSEDEGQGKLWSCDEVTAELGGMASWEKWRKADGWGASRW